jgi:hypothetical protein
MKTALTLITIAALTLSPTFAKDADIVIKCTIGKGKDSISFPATTGKQNKELTLQATREIPIPTKWDLPHWGNGADRQRTVVIPITPIEFETIQSGWTIRCSGDTVDRDLIRLVGVVSFLESQLAQGVYGEQSGPIYSPDNTKIMLTPNKAQSAATILSETRFQLFAKPGKEYEFTVKRLGQSIPIRITCSLKK